MLRKWAVSRRYEHDKLSVCTRGSRPFNHHGVLRPMAKDGVGRCTHYFAIIREKGAGQRWALDGSMRANGREPIIMQA